MSRRFRYYVLAAALLISISFALNQDSDQASDQDYTVKLSPDRYMTDENGMTLYYSLNDAPGSGISNCVDECSSLWPPFYADLIRVPAMLSTSSFNTVSRIDDCYQTTYEGWPLYRCSRDKKPGDTEGDGEKGIWFVVDPIKFPPAYGGSDGSNTWLFHIRSFLNKFD
ncbi:MAG: hypothetical protein WAV83_10145 [Methanothrix sp.]|uniref:COG4315 family predicted lipoprotein n=1 Tax=Methanothrix sp. TaxID=90426 RepID=UPI003BB0CDEA